MIGSGHQVYCKPTCGSDCQVTGDTISDRTRSVSNCNTSDGRAQARTSLSTRRVRQTQQQYRLFKYSETLRKGETEGVQGRPGKREKGVLTGARSTRPRKAAAQLFEATDKSWMSRSHRR